MWPCPQKNGDTTILASPTWLKSGSKIGKSRPWKQPHIRARKPTACNVGCRVHLLNDSLVLKRDGP